MPTIAEIRKQLIDAARADQSVCITSMHDELECVCNGHIFNVGRTHVIITRRQSETAVPIASILDVTVRSAVVQKPAMEAA